MEPHLADCSNSIRYALVKWFLFNHIESPSEHLLSYYALEMNFDSTNNSIILKYIVKGTYSPVSPEWYICLLLNLPSLCIIRS